MASGSALRVGSGLMSCTDAVQISEPFLFENRTVRLIDTPGFDDTSKTDTEVLTMIAASLSSMYRGGVKLSGAIYIHRISDVRMGGASTRNFKLFRGLCGDNMLQNVVIVTNMWSQVPLDVGEAREEELKRSWWTSKSHHRNAAGAELGRELHEQATRYEEERRRLHDEMNEALSQRDEQAREELEQATAQLNRDMMRVENERQQLASSYADENERLEITQRASEVAARRESERRAAGIKGRCLISMTG
ncbi:P-loop containing nucleoside triphosphate hydrolase protein [Salix suchowensis]|nr:P-loop containing nucleoside triphosphate hydrolase protein [Salix suchowensis]